VQGISSLFERTGFIVCTFRPLQREFSYVW